MSAKKNLTVAALAALLAVPAFGATNVPHALHIPSVTAHAASTVSIPSSYTGHWSGRGSMGRWSVDLGRNGGYMHRHAPGDNEQGAIAYTQNSNGKYSWWPKNAIGKAGAGPAGSYFYLLPNGQLAWKEDVSTSYLHRDSSSKPSTNGSQNNNQATNGNENGTNNAANSSANASNASTNTNNVRNQSNGNSTQYTSKSKLPQTGESNGSSKAMVMGAVALGASASFMALSMARKHRQESELDSVSSEPTVDDGDGNDDKSNDDDADDIDTDYHMIMSDMFDNISKDLKQM